MSITNSSVRVIDVVAVAFWVLATVVAGIEYFSNDNHFEDGLGRAIAIGATSVTNIACITWLMHAMDKRDAHQVIDEISERRGWNE